MAELRPRFTFIYSLFCINLLRGIYIIFSDVNISKTSYEVIDSRTIFFSWTYECIACQIENFDVTAISLSGTQVYFITVPASLNECTMEVDDACEGFEVTMNSLSYNRTLQDPFTYNIPANSFSEYY